MKNNISFAALCALSACILLLSCNGNCVSTSEITNVASDPVSIRLAPVCIGGAAKSFEETTLATIQRDGFSCMSYLSDSRALYIDRDVLYDGRNYVFRDASYYYPLEGALDFYAVYPMGLGMGLNPQGDFQVEFAYDPDADLVVASALGKTRQSGEVTFEFNHVLANVALKCRGGDQNVLYTVSSVELQTAAAGSYNVSRGEWTVGSGVVPEEFVQSQTTLSATPLALGGYVSCIPCTAAVRARWKCLDKTTGTLLAEYDQSVPVTLVPGCRSTFNLTLPNSKAMQIDCAVSVSAWDSASEDVVIF